MKQDPVKGDFRLEEPIQLSLDLQSMQTHFF